MKRPNLHWAEWVYAFGHFSVFFNRLMGFGLILDLSFNSFLGFFVSF